jgi:anti-anti-sigma regulatory factor
MLKITVHDIAGQLRIALAGRLAGAWVCELEQCGHAARASHPHRPLMVDLTSVTFVDQAGRYLLQLMHRDSVRFVASGLLRQDLVEHITGTTESGTSED